MFQSRQAQQRLIDETGERRHLPKRVDDAAVEARDSRQSVPEILVRRETAGTSSIRPLRDPRKATRDSLKLVPAQPADRPLESRRFDNRAKTSEVGGDVFPDGLQG